MKKQSHFRYFGVGLIVLGLLFMTGLLFSFGSYCLGFSLFGACGGLSVPLNLVIGLVTAAIGTVVYVRR